MLNDNKIILAIESAIGGGSISLYRGTTELTTLEGEKEISRAEDLLSNISAILEENSLKFNDLNEIAVSVGPGSYTGIRVGIATALGLRKSLGTSCEGVDTLQALCLLAAKHERVISAVPLGRADVCWRVIENGNKGPIVLNKKEVFNDTISSREDIVVVVHEALYDGIEGHVINAGPGMSRYIAEAARAGKYTNSLEPLYVRG